ncbi:hypothetical protein RhiirA5_497429 [Rhizophagus irregularis]|uniref:SbsA Ig-like domain-containing protein n=1 Tax=Rhizophagus irregularis TaxID=588596 RepID=A0A2N0PY79_9GLOM|nr:hypothetical protein RhiirA5_497429 [Rhizophagus irregularis]
MSVIFRNNTSSIIFIVLVIILISCPPIQTKDDPFRNAKAIGAYDDGTILVEVKDSLRLIYPNGTPHSIPKIHCKKKCHYHLLNPNYVIITYDNNVGMIIDWKGSKILKRFKYDKLSIGEKNDKFLIMRHNEFTEYHIEHGKIVKITNSLHFDKSHKEHKEHKITEIFSLDDAWGITISSEKKKSFFSIIKTESKSKTLTTEELEDFAGPSKCITKNKNNDIQYYCLYRTHTHRLKLVNIKNLSLNDNTFDLTSTDLFQSDISFETKTFIHIMPNVGFLVEATAKLNPKYYIFNIFEIDYFDPNNAFGEWIINNNDNDFIDDNIFILPNNKAIQIRKNGKYVNDLSSKIPENNQYKNTHIKSVPNNVDIGTTTLKITFLNAITSTTTTAANISIYYKNKNSNEIILRQKLLCKKHCTISDDDYSLTIDIPKITFNMPNTTYYVEIDDDFVKYKYDLITIPGIKKENWIINTPDYKYSNEDDKFKLGNLRLNSIGTEEFDKLSDADKDYFSDQMRIELSKNIPVDYSRIKINDKKYEFDMTLGVNLYKFLIQIDPPNEYSDNKKSTKQVFEDLNSLIITSQNLTTNLDYNNYTKNIDKDYGLKEASDTLAELKASLNNFIADRRYLIIIIVCLILIAMLYFYGRYKNKKGTNIIVFKVALIIIDLINDIRFIIKLKTISSGLFIPSVLFLLFPFILNVFFAIAIFKFEIQNSINSEWFKNYIKPVAIATILSSGDIELLHIFDSNFGGFKIFSVKFSPKTLNLIFWGGFLNIILENLPQLVIQILYAINSSSGINDVTALFTLIISIIVFLVSVIECSYHIFMNNKNENHVGIHIVERDIKH